MSNIAAWIYFVGLSILLTAIFNKLDEILKELKELNNKKVD
jgi:hypothetical protein